MPLGVKVVRGGMMCRGPAIAPPHDKLAKGALSLHNTLSCFCTL